MEDHRLFSLSSKATRSSQRVSPLRGAAPLGALRTASILLPALVLGLAQASIAQQPMPPQFQTWARYWPTLGTGVIGMRGQVSDLNADEIPDVVILWISQPVVGLGKGNGEFEWQYPLLPPPPSPPGFMFTNAVAAGRLSPGARPEIIVGRDMEGLYLAPLVLLSSDTSGAFQADTTGRLPQIPGNPYAILLIDVDKDGDLDLFVGGSFGHPSMLWLNDGQGRFQDATNTHLPFTNWSTMDVVQVDVNGDGWPDIACANGGYGVAPERELIYLNDGTGRFQVQFLPGGLTASASITTDDFDGDGWPDLFVGDMSTISKPGNPQKLYMNQGGNGFLDSTHLLPPIRNGAVLDVLTTDIDGDGRPDLVIGGNIGLFPNIVNPPMPRIYLNRLPSGFVDATDALVPSVNNRADLLLAGDFDMDGDEDILMQRFNFGDTRWPILFNVRRHLYTQDQMKIGAPFTIQCWGDIGHVAMPLLSFAPARLPLPGLGILGLDPARSVILPFLVLLTDRKATLTLQVPADPSLRGHTIYTQALDLDPRNLALSHLTNWVRDVVQ
jgi:hypothetical protein